MVGAAPLMGEPYCFLETIGSIEPHIWGKMCPQNQFFGFQSDGMGFFEKKLKNCIWHPIYKKKKVIFIFVVRPPRSLKNGDTPNNNFSLIF